MTDLYPHIFSTLKASSYFATTLSGFKDSDGNFKVFREDESPSEETPFVTVEVRPGDESQLTGWIKPHVIFAVFGKDTEWDTLYSIANAIKDIFKSSNIFASVNGEPRLQYQLLGDSDFDKDRDPVSEDVNVSVALQFGIAL